MTQTSPAAARQLDAIPVHRKSLSQRLRENWQLYVMLLIPVVLTIVYKYAILIGTIFENCDTNAAVYPFRRLLRCFSDQNS